MIATMPTEIKIPTIALAQIRIKTLLNSNGPYEVVAL